MTKILLFLVLLSVSTSSLLLVGQNSLANDPPDETFSQQGEEIILGTIPHRVYKENDGVVVPDVTESFIFNRESETMNRTAAAGASNLRMTS